jgi:hypothetical protein
MSIETQAYETEDLIAGQVITRDDAALAADTYYTGMPLKATAAVYGYDAADPEAIYMGPDARVLGAPGVGSIIVWGEVLAGGIVDDSGAALSVTDAVIVAAKANGIFIKNKANA